MRKATREAIEAAEQSMKGILHDLFAEATQERLGESDRIVKAISEIQPASVDLTQEMADDIVRKIHGPLTIPQHFSDWIKQQAKYKDMLYISPLGYNNPNTVYYTFKANGTLHLLFKDAYGTPMWEGTFVPPDFGKEPAE